MKKINVIIPAAGAATRLKPLSNNTSKAMVRINGKPCIDFIIESILDQAEIEQMIIVDGKFKDIRDYVPRRWSKINTSFVTQETLDGPRNAIHLGVNLIENVNIPTVIWLGDAIILEECMPLGEDFLLAKYVSDQHNWCMWDQGTQEFYNKPKHPVNNACALVGLYSFSDTVKLNDALDMSYDMYEISDMLERYENNFEKVLTDRWYDIGEISSYYNTCASLLSLKSRSFNTLKYDPELGVLHKKPDYHNIDAIHSVESERAWYRSLDWKQQLFVPRFIDSNTDLIISYEPGVLLSDLLMYEELAPSTWEYILDKLFHTVTTYFHNSSNRSDENIYTFSANSKRMWIEKAESRLSGSPFSYEERDQLISYGHEIYKSSLPVACMHGDLHFGNVLYNAQNDKLTLIDPRGEYGDIQGSLGDNIYDWSKLAQELVFGYNHLLANMPYTRQEEMNRIFFRMCKKYNVDYDLAVKGGVILLATCIPLHQDDPMRQIRFSDKVKEFLNDKSSFHSF